MLMTPEELRAAVAVFRDAGDEWVTAQLADPITGEIFAVVELAPGQVQSRAARVRALRAQVKGELISNLQTNTDW